ncbi:universal stress protein [Candidatus Nitrosotenuis chungbukensis]|uniref:universal stress protein n=1 Tax=Candidatus Nitrosotenuis chungbukensis TaxID=1353246 RepID=UPI0005B27AC7|nr:universal stress protein [Candidatus Nitrosotenuis chungbukensis]WKT57875.1 universal stress protein [Candidatus Nitrosotenuis chungbukensis]
MYKKILVPYAGSKPSDRALESAVMLAKHSGANVFLLNIVPDILLPPLVASMASITVLAKTRFGFGTSARA